MPEDKDASTPPRPAADHRHEERGDKGIFSDKVQKGYQTPQDRDEHWNPPEPTKSDE